MKGKNVFLTLLIISICGLMLSCQRQVGKKKLYSEIENLQEQLAQALSDSQLDTLSAVKLINKSIAYATRYQRDTLTPSYLFRAADVARGIGKYQQAIKLWEQVETQYSTFVKAPEALFFQGFTYENDLQQPEQAKEYYQLFIKKYPQHPLISTVQACLLNLSETPVELIKKFKKQQD